MIIIETCPKCGHDLQSLTIATYPPIPKKECWNCGWSWVGEPEEVARMPFGGNRLIVNDISKLEDHTILNITDNDTLNETIYTNDWGSTLGTFGQSSCENCSNNPKNGGSGICNCTLGLPKVFC